MGLGKLTKIEVNATPEMVAEIEGLWGEKFTEGEPTVAGYYDQRGKLRRIVALYPDGWRLQVNINAEGCVTSAHGKISYSGKIKGCEPASSSEAVGDKNA